MSILINFKASAKFKEFIKKYAEKEHRSLSGMIKHCIRTYIEEHHGGKFTGEESEE
jgi:hypothetical protein